MSLTVEFQVKIQYKLCIVQYSVMYILNAFYAKIKLGIRQIPFLFSYDILRHRKIGARMSKNCEVLFRQQNRRAGLSRMFSSVGPELVYAELT